VKAGRAGTSDQLPIAYRGRRNAGVGIEVLAPDGTWHAQESRLDLRALLRPIGCGWGWGASALAHVALALAGTRLPDDEAASICQDLLRALAARLAEDPWRLDAALLEELLNEIGAEAADGAAGRGAGNSGGRGSCPSPRCL
jgi:hypothetical protein